MSYKTTLLSLLLFFGCTSLSLNAQIINNITKPSLTKYSLAEKIYLQINNTIYQTGETIWFKAIVSRSFDNSLSDLSEVLYVELIDFNETIIERKVLKLKEGIVSDSFELQESYKSGKYLIRAYTNWNRNFAEDFMFSQTIDVFNLKEQVESIKNPITNVVVYTDKDKLLTADIDPRLINPRYRGNLKLYIDTGNSIDSVELSREKGDIYKLSYNLPENITQAELRFSTQASGKIFATSIPDDYSKTIVIDKDYLDVQFFPEGGKLVNGLISTVAFKSLNHKGLGYKISGYIKNGQGNTITTFSSNDLGLGTFKFFPEIGNNYYAEVSINGVTYKYSLPVANKTGSVLSVVKLKNDLRILLASNTKNIGDVRIQTESKGIKYHDLSFKSKDTITAIISSESLPEGIIKMTVLNNIEQVICERLVFNSKPNDRLVLDVKSNYEIYNQRDKTTLKVRLDSLQHLQKTSLSVLVLTKERSEISKRYKPHLMSYLLLSSELKGFIENSSFYFDTKNRTRTLDLDALMLTQGWRTYKYHNKAEATNYIFEPEKSLVISGTIGEYFNPKKRPKKPLDLNMIVYGEPEEIYKQEIDSSGKYYFEIDDIFKSKIELFMQVVNKKGEPIDFSINLDKKWTPEIKMTKTQKITLPDELITTFIDKSKIVNKRQRDYKTFYNTIALDEVELKDYKLTPEREKSIEENGEPSYVIDKKELDKNTKDWAVGLFSVLEYNYPKLIRFKEFGPLNDRVLCAITRKANFTFILFDGIPVWSGDYRYIGNFPLEDIKSIDIIEKPKNPYKYVSDIYGRIIIIPSDNPGYRVSLINVYTYSKKGFYRSIKPEGVLTDYVKGFSESIEFYTPNYETLTNQDWNIPDNRSVIHWSPKIQLDKNGEYTLEFYNDDHIGEVSIIVEAISKDGKIGYLEKTYTIKEAER